jgi:hypothetical protein
MPCGIEVKPTNRHQNESVLQLAIWFTARLARIEELGKLAKAESTGERGGGAGIVDTEDPLPLVSWTVVGHDWRRFYIAWKDASKDNYSGDVVRPVLFIRVSMLTWADYA